MSGTGKSDEEIECSIIERVPVSQFGTSQYRFSEEERNFIVKALREARQQDADGDFKPKDDPRTFKECNTDAK